jgi:hypothetical protein
VKGGEGSASHRQSQTRQTARPPWSWPSPFASLIFFPASLCLPILVAQILVHMPGCPSIYIVRESEGEGEGTHTGGWWDS